MHLTIEWHNEQFNINLATAEGKDSFLSIKGCRIVSGPKGDFVAMPSTKNQNTGKYWNHAWVSEQFNKHVLALAKQSEPGKKKPSFDDVGDDIPF